MGHRVDVVQYLFEYFDVYVPPAVRAEVMAVDPVYPRRRYGYAVLFDVLESRGLLIPAAPTAASPQYGRGEAETLALAEEQGWWLLINDARPLRTAQQRDIKTLSVPTFVLFLYEQEVLSLRSAEAKLQRISSLTAQSVLRPARQVLDQLARARKER